MSEAPVMLLLFRVINLTVVGRLNLKKTSSIDIAEKLLMKMANIIVAIKSA